MFKLFGLKNYKTLYKQEKLRADLLQQDLDEADELHFDECQRLINCIDELRAQLVRTVNKK